jgi:hypothetical protein
MINAVLVFNNNGQPRLTKFYTQLVSYLKKSTHLLPPSCRKLPNTPPRTPQSNNA